jgi:hypothetical protein
LHGIKIDLKSVKREVEELSQGQKDLMVGVIKAATQRRVKERADKARKRLNV